MKLTVSQREELDALRLSYDATGKPSAIFIGHRQSGVCYDDLHEAGLVKIYARPPKGFSRTRFFGARITEAGRAALSE